MENFNLDKYFDVTDSMNLGDFLSFFCEDATWSYANMEALKGIDSISQMAESFFNNLNSISHERLFEQRVGDLIFFEGQVHYDRKDGKKINLPFACTMRLVDEKIKEYRTYIDPTPYLT